MSFQGIEIYDEQEFYDRFPQFVEHVSPRICSSYEFIHAWEIIPGAIDVAFVNSMDNDDYFNVEFFPDNAANSRLFNEEVG